MERVRRQIELWARDLIDLTRRNRAIYYRPTKRTTLELISPAPGAIYDQVLADELLSFFEPPPRPDDEPWTVEESVERARPDELVSKFVVTSELEKTLKTLSRYADQDIMDRGVQTLYLTFGVLEWREASGDDGQVTSPLLYVPVELHRESPRDPFRLRRSPEDLLLNPSLVVKLEHDFGLDLRGIAGGIDDAVELGDVLDEVRRVIAAKGWEVGPSVILTRSTFHKEAMYRDLMDNIDLIAEHEIVRSLAGDSTALDDAVVGALPEEAQLDDESPPEEGHLILDADASQRRAVLAAVRGGSFVMDGPPGTGKSQTIANMIAELVSAEKKVLFVSEKAAALEVVARRLRERGLDEFALELHSHKASRKEVVQVLDRSLKRHLRPEPRMSTTDRRRARDRRQQLTDYADAVNEQREPFGRTVNWAVGRVARVDHAPALPVPANANAGLSADTFDAWCQRFDQLARVWIAATVPGFVWRGYVGDQLRLGEREQIAEEISRCRLALRSVQEAGDELAYHLAQDAVRDFGGVNRLVELCVHLHHQPETPEGWWTVPSLQALHERVRELETAVERHRRALEHLEAHYDVPVEELPEVDVAELRELLQQLQELFPGFRAETTITTSQSKQWRHIIESVAAEVASIDADAKFVLERLRVPDHAVRFSRMQRIAEAVAPGDTQHIPESEWTTPARTRQLLGAIESLRLAQEAFIRSWSPLEEVFQDAVLDLDLVTIRVRLEQTTGLRKLAKPYREAKAQLRDVTRSGRVDREIVGQLAQVAEAQRARKQLDDLERQHASTLGAFYQPRSSDLDGATRVADMLIELQASLADDYDAEAVAEQFSNLNDGRVELAEAGRRLADSIKRLLANADLMGVLAPEEAGRFTAVGLGTWASRRTEPLVKLEQVAQSLVAHRTSAPAAQDLIGDANSIETVRDVRRQMAVTEDDEREHLGPWSSGLATDLEGLQHAIAWTERLRELLGGPATRRQVERCRRALDELPRSEEVEAEIDRWMKTTSDLLERFEPDRQAELQQELNGTINDAAALLAELEDRTDDIELWCECRRLWRDLAMEGFESTLETARQRSVDATELPDALQRATLTGWLEDVCDADGRLDPLRPEHRDALVDEYRQLDRRLIDDAADQVIMACNGRRPRTNIGGVATIQREAQKKRRHMPVRQLLEQTLDVATALKPCFMMSPLSVSQFLPSARLFDVVIFDEASQVPPADAINCVYRGQQLVIAGDDRQLPPTSFFDVMMDEDDVYEEEQFDDFESVLGLCKAAELLHALPLRWHYRSQHEDLITFSNYRFYEGQLITYPGAEVARPDLGVEHFQIDGVYRRGGRRDNPAEASFVAERVLHHALEHPRRSVGVVALSNVQADAIEDAVDRLRRDHPELDEYFAADRLDGFFVKNLESVQGDERDLIILSIGYGPDEAGKFTMNFGPLNREGGWRRLNVAITRARRRVEVVSSFGSEQMRLGQTGSRGVRELHTYLDYLTSGHAALAVDLEESQGDVESPLEAEVLRTVRSWGYEVVPQVGAAGYRIDMAVRDPDAPGRYLIGIECDGAAYHSSRVARDRDRLRQEVLEGLGWRLHRVWGPSWFRYRAQAEEDLRNAIEGATARAEASDRGSERGRLRQRATEEVDLSALPAWASHYEAAQPRARTADRAHSARGLGELGPMIEDIVLVEAPVHREVIGRRVADAFGHNLTRRTQAAVDGTIDSLANKGVLSRRGEFVYLSEVESVRVPRGQDDAFRRDAKHIPPDEIELAVFHLLEDARSADEDELLEYLKRLFGFQRMGPQVAAALEGALDRLEARGLVERDSDGRVRPAPGE